MIHHGVVISGEGFVMYICIYNIYIYIYIYMYKYKLSVLVCIQDTVLNNYEEHITLPRSTYIFSYTTEAPHC